MICQLYVKILLFFGGFFLFFLITTLNKQIQDIRCDEEREKEKRKVKIREFGGGKLSRVWGRNMI